MFIDKSYSIRHQILKVLQEHDKDFEPDISLDKRSIHFNDISSRLNYPDKQFLIDNLDYLRAANEIYCSLEFDNSVFAIYSAGSHAYRQKKYIREGVKEQLNYIYDIAKTFSVIILLFIAILTFAKNIYQTESNKQDIEQLQKDIQQIKNKIQQRTPPLLNPSSDTLKNK